MALDYLNSSGIAIARLEAAHDPKKSQIRAQFFEAENAFFAKYIQGQRVLVAGAGLGHDAFTLSAYNQKVVGIELHPILVARATEYLLQRGLQNVHFLQGDVMQLPFAKNTFDAVVMNMGTLGTLDDHIGALREMQRVAPVVYADFYPPTLRAIAKRVQMYTEEGWKNARHDRLQGAIVSDDGMFSLSYSKLMIEQLAREVHMHVTLTPLCDFAYMAKFWRK
ncbi:MAG: class I SAM-dependent methyltransferase [Patescibacteria group bacterium]|jgi:ubiquinone/menaquinone biosynthesis C-methylase UbiE